MVVLSMLVFASALALAFATIVTSIAPQWRRIASLATGHIESVYATPEILAERRLAVRRWASAPIPAPIRRLRAVA